MGESGVERVSGYGVLVVVSCTSLTSSWRLPPQLAACLHRACVCVVGRVRTCAYDAASPPDAGRCRRPSSVVVFDKSDGSGRTTGRGADRGEDEGGGGEAYRGG